MSTVATSGNAQLVAMINNRRSSRAFKADPVPKNVLELVMEAAINAPSWSNTQPWEFTIVGGQTMERLKSTLLEKATSGVTPNPDIAFPVFPEVYRERSRDNGRRLYDVLGIARDDKARRTEFSLSMTKFFGAPNGIIVFIDKELGPYSILDAGIAVQNILLAAHGLGLGTCPEAAVVTHPDVLREMLGIPASKTILCGIAIGYPEADSPLNTFHSGRDKMDAFVTWCDVV